MPLNNALSLDLLEFPLLLIRPGESKAPVQKGWPTTVLTEDDLRAAFAADPNQGLGVKLGGDVGFIDIEGDGESAETDWGILTNGINIPDTCGWTSSRGKHRLFVLTDSLRDIVGQGVVKLNDLEIRLGTSDRYTHYSIVPPFGGREWIGQLSAATLPLELANRIAQLRHVDASAYNSDYVNPNPDSPGTVFNELEDWDSLLLGDGWKKLSSRKDGVSDWCRPGKESGLSATTGFCGDRLYVFTTEAPHLESGISYDKFQYFTFTKYDGDFTTSAQDLARNGYIRESDCGFSDLSGVAESTKAGETSVVEGFFEEREDEEIDEEQEARNVPTELLLFPGFVENFAAWHEKRSHRPDQRVGAIAGILMQSWLMGRRVKQVDGTRPNVSMLMVGPSGSGKTEAISGIKDVIHAMGVKSCVHSNFRSWQALEDQIERTPNMMFVQEESQNLLRAMADDRDTNAALFASHLKQIATASKDEYKTRSAVNSAGGEGTPVDQPSLALLMTGTPREVWAAMDESMMRDGFVGRMFSLELLGIPDLNRNVVDDKKIFTKLVDHSREWYTRAVSEEAAPDSLDADAVTVGKLLPDVITRTEQAEKVANKFSAKCDKLVKAAYAKDESDSSMWSRGFELMCTLELLIAGSASCGSCKITQQDTERAVKIVEFAVAQKMYRMETRELAKSTFGPFCDRLVSFLERQAKRGKNKVTWRAAYKSMHMPVWEFNNVIVAVLAAGQVMSDAKISIDGSKVFHQGKFLCLPKFGRNFLAPSDDAG